MIFMVKGKVVFCFSVLLYWDVIGFVMFGIFFLMIFEISVDCLLVFCLKFRYREVVFFGCMCLVVVMIWLLSFVVGLVSLWN